MNKNLMLMSAMAAGLVSAGAYNGTMDLLRCPSPKKNKKPATKRPKSKQQKQSRKKNRN